MGNFGSSLGVPSHVVLKTGAKKARSPVTITSETNGLFFTAVLSPVISPGVFNPLFPYQSGSPPQKKNKYSISSAKNITQAKLHLVGGICCKGCN